MNREDLIAAQAGLAKVDENFEDGGASVLMSVLKASAGPVRPGATILDFGCGVGKSVSSLLKQGYDAYGVDVYEYWGRDRDLYWEATQRPVPANVRDRLRLAVLSPYALPFPDDSFDHIISNQVLEHVDDLEAVFAEIARTLRPGGTSVHIFPGRWAPLIEAHISVPISVLCHNRLYLKAMARIGIRNVRQRGVGWKEVYRTNCEQMKITHYPRRREIQAKAERAGLRVRFVHDSVNVRPAFSRLHRALVAIGAPGVAKRVLMMLQQPRLVLTRPAEESRLPADPALALAS